MSINNLFGCSETPLKFPNNLPITDSTLNVCRACKVRFTAKVAGPGRLTPSTEGFVVDENPQTTLTYNGLQYSLNETRLLMEGAHILPGDTKPAEAELHFYFGGNEKSPNVAYSLVIPIKVGEGVGNTYFSMLDQVTMKRPTPTSLFTTQAPLIQYTGADIRGRTKPKPRPTNQCEPVARKIRYIVSSKPAYIRASDLTRLKDKLDGEIYVGPPQASTPPSKDRISSLVTVIPSILLVGPQNTNTASQAPTGDPIPTKALKCHRIDSQRDIVGDKVYVGGRPGGKTLQEEMEAAANSQAVYEGTDKPTIQPGDIENAMAIVVGVLMGLIVAATIAYYGLKWVFSRYLKAQNLYNIADPIASVGKFVSTSPTTK